MTKIEVIFQRFLQKLSDYKFIVDPKNQNEVKHLEDTMSDYLATARAKFYHTDKDLSLNTNSMIKFVDDNGEDKELHYSELDNADISLEKLTELKSIKINSDLTDMEIEILSMLMLVEYFKQIMIRNETLEQAVGDSDFNIYSQANHINQLKDLYRELKREVNTEIGRYTYIGTVYGKRKS